jgi:DNA (cytosine-5)-methyltransferase 1
MMRSLDLFSGIGGFSLALRDVTTTVAYCEIDPYSRAVLEDNMRQNNIDKAPIFRDVTQLKSTDVAKLRPEIVMGGFPCQDIAFSGHGAGLDGSRSNLFFEIVRIVRSSDTIEHVFLENSPFIRMRGLDRVLASLRSMGFRHVVYGYLSASDVGAVHKRTRWVCLASKDPSKLRLNTLTKHRQRMRFDWSAEPVPRVVRRFPPEEQHRNATMQDRVSMLGNSVVPQFIAHVYDTFSRALRLTALMTPTALAKSYPEVEDVGHRGVLYVATDSNMQNNSRKKKTTVWRQLPYREYASNTLDLHLVDHNGKEFYSIERWYTPVHSRSAWVHVLRKTKKGRWMCNTANNIYYERKTRAKPRVHVINPEFIEHLMGYPIGWTEAAVKLQRVPRHSIA